MERNYRDIPSVPGAKRTYSPEEAGNEKYRTPVSRYRRRKRQPPNAGVIILVLVFAIVVGVCIFVMLNGKKGPQAGNPLLVVTTEENLTTAPPKEITVTKTVAEMHMGNLILVNYAYPYAFADAEVNEITTVMSQKNSHYVARDNKVSLRLPVIQVFNTLMESFDAQTGCPYMQVNSAYRSYQEQFDLYESYKADKGEEYAKAYVATPGYSEHHTGLALDLNVLVPNEGIYYVESYPACEWFREHCNDFGFVLRYPKDKVYITAINHESWHYRYVGAPHAQIMKELNLCLEEYTDYLKTYSYNGTMLWYNNGISQTSNIDDVKSGSVIYFVPATGDATEITVPNGVEYEISGNNVDGFIVTITK